MKLRTLLALSLLTLASAAQEGAPPRELIIAAIGEIPVPRMKVANTDGFRGYVHDEKSTNQWFPQDWTVGGQAVKLALNIEPVVVKMPLGKEPFNLSPVGAAPKPQTLPAPAANGATMMVIFNRETKKPWNEGFGTWFVNCKKLNSANPDAVVVNLSGAIVSISARDRTIQKIAPDKSAVAAVLVNQQSGLKLLPLSAAAAGKTYSLNVVPLDLRGSWCPVIVIYPSAGPSSKARPLQVAVIQPSDAVRANQPTAIPRK